MTTLPRETFHFRLFVAGESPNSARALANLRALCAEHLPGRHEIEIVDVLRASEHDLEKDILLTPTLVKFAPKPVKKIIGNLSDFATVRQTLGLEASR
ncbi:MAG: circadian clock KaiB family protein [Vicinamibacteria bacterium]